jgi:hypothetical protein
MSRWSPNPRSISLCGRNLYITETHLWVELVFNWRVQSFTDNWFTIYFDEIQKYYIESFLGDGIHQCFNGEDESSSYCITNHNQSATIPEPYKCFSQGWFNCGHDCVLNKYRCNGEVDCKLNKNDENFCHARTTNRRKYSKAIKATKLTRKKRRVLDFHDTWRCHHGLYVNKGPPSDLNERCFCPPSAFGDHCEFYTHHLTVVFTLDMTLDMSKTNSTAVRVVTLLEYRGKIIDFMILSYNSIQLPLETKQRFYLFYPWSLLETIREASSKDYTVTFHLYSVTQNKIDLLSIRRYPVKFPFLPAFRVTAQLIYRRSSTCSSKTIQSCGLHSTGCHMIDETTPYCECESPWYGPECSERPSISPCANLSLYFPSYRYGINGTGDFVCVCTGNQKGRTCHVSSTSDVASFTENHHTCYRLTEDTYDLYSSVTHCICPLNLYGSR